jgi:hypothetical protein
MSLIDQRDKSLVYTGGSSKLAVGLTAAQAVAAFGDPSATGGWYILSHSENTQVGPSRDVTEVKDEADNAIINRTDRDEFNIVSNFFQTDDPTLSLLEWMEDADNAVPLRYPMPTNLTTEDQWVFLYNANVRKEDWQIEAANQATRQRQVTFVGTKDSNGDLKDIVTLPTDQSDSAWDDYADFKDDALP